MIHAYDETYLVHSSRVLGWMLDSAVNLFGMKAEAFWGIFISTGYADRFGKGESRLLAGMTGYELAREILDAARRNTTPSSLPKSPTSPRNTGRDGRLRTTSGRPRFHSQR